MRRRLASAFLALGLVPLGSTLGSAQTPQILLSENVDVLGTIPTDALASSIAFASDKPVMYVSTWRGLEIWDITNPTLPLPMGVEVLAGHQNEAMSLGERPNGDKFVLFASNSAAADTTGYNNATNRVVTVVEVTNPRDPAIVGHVSTPTRTHTASCLTRTCEFAYTDGRTQGEMSVVDLRDFRNPKLGTPSTIKTVVAQGHDEDYDAAGVLWHVGGQGSVALDVTDPQAPRHLNSTTIDAFGPRPWNRFIHHNSQRPFAQNFRHLTYVDENGQEQLLLDEKGLPQSGEPSLQAGNVLLVTEELNLETGCATGEGEGAFQTWHIPFLHADSYDRVNPGKSAGKGTIYPLDKWNTELGTGTPVRRVPGFCSSHYFDFHTNGIVAAGFYEQGVRFLDVRNPLDIKQVGWWMTAGMETWAAYWVPEYGPDGKQTGRQTNIVYSADNARGVDMLRFDFSSLGSPQETENRTAPILADWFQRAEAVAERRSPLWGYACREVDALRVG